MKYSIYNSYILISSDKLLVYNSLSDGFAVLYDNFDSCSVDYLPDCCDLNTSYRDSLLQIGAIIEDDEVDEYLILKDIIDKLDEDKTNIHLHINPTLDCNFNCWYCYEKHLNVLLWTIRHWKL